MTSVVSTGKEVVRGIKQTHALIKSHASAGWLVLGGGTGIKGQRRGEFSSAAAACKSSQTSRTMSYVYTCARTHTEQQDRANLCETFAV